MASLRAFRSPSEGTETYAARAASIGILIFLLASLTDYPLRTPLLGAICAIFCAMLAQPAKSLPKKAKF
jgi:hypothetical protein